MQDNKNPSRRDWHLASTLEVRQNILDTCKTRLMNNVGDEWALKVQSRIQDCIDFVASEARYHQICRLRFQTSKNLSDEQKGQRKNEEMMECFQKACEWLETEASVQTMPDL